MQTLVYLGLGTLGSLLPDLDANNSVPTRVGTSLFAITLAFGTVFLLANTRSSLVELALAWLITYVVCRTLVFVLFTRFSVHRGVFHSVPAAALFGLLTTVFAARLLQQPPLRAWLAGSFVAGGYLVHLILDEWYSVSLANLRVRRSLGSACKLWSRASPAATLCLYLACVTLYSFTPSAVPFVKALGSPQTYVRIQQRLLPRWTLPTSVRAVWRRFKIGAQASARSLGSSSSGG